MRKLNLYFFIFTFFVFFTKVSYSQPTIDGTLNDAQYTVIGTTNSNDGYGSGNNLNKLCYYQDGTYMYIGISCDLNSNNNVVLFMNFSGYGGRGINQLAGSTTSSSGVFTTSGGGLYHATMDMDVDYIFAFNEGSSTDKLYMDAARLGSDGYIATGYIGAVNDQAGTSVSLSTNTITGGTGNMTLAYNSGGASSNKGIEIKIPISAFAGVTSAQTVQFFVLITNNVGSASNESIPGMNYGGNPGDNYNFAGLSGQDLFTSPTSNLPVELTSFSGRVTKEGTNLAWNTATEVNNTGFDVERSLDKNNWQKIAFVNGSGNSNSPKDYSYTDNYSYNGICYYRLKQIDTDGKYTYSKIIEIKGASNVADFNLAQNYPNPFNPCTNINFSLNESGKAKLTVYDILGKERAVLFNGNVEAGKNYNVSFNGSNLESGVYFYKLTSGSVTSVKKMMLVK
jgi:hypothetical protein